MQKSFFSLLFLALSYVSIAQLTVSSAGSETVIGEVRKLGAPQATLTRLVTNTDTTYTIRYRDFQDMETNKYFNIEFKASAPELAQLHKIFMSVYAPENAKNKSYSGIFTLGTTPITVKNYTYSGFTMCEVRTPSGFFQLTQGQVNKLFGK